MKPKRNTGKDKTAAQKDELRYAFEEVDFLVAGSDLRYSGVTRSQGQPALVRVSLAPMPITDRLSLRVANFI